MQIMRLINLFTGNVKIDSQQKINYSFRIQNSKTEFLRLIYRQDNNFQGGFIKNYKSSTFVCREHSNFIKRKVI